MDPVLNVSDFLLARGGDGDTAVVDGGRHHSYRELREAVGRLVAELDVLGLAPGSRVSVLGANSFFWIAAYLAVIRSGHVAVPLSDRLTPDDVRRNLALVGSSAALVDRRCLRRLSGALPPEVAVLTDEALETGREPTWSCVPCAPDADAVLLFTSGTTARPRAVRITHRNIQANTTSIIEFLGLDATDRVLVVLPFFYCYGASLLHTHLRAGARVVVCNSFTFPETAVDVIEREECTVLAGVPSSYQLLLRASSFSTRELPSLRMLQQAGGALPPVLVQELTAAKPHAQLFVMYGQTEATARLSYLPPDRLGDKLGSIGRGIPGVSLCVLGPDGRPVPPGERGEIYASGDNISPGYLDAPDASASKFTPHGLRTGDLAVVDDEGFIFVVDRRDDFIKSWGYRISSQEIEACVLGLEQLVSAAAIGVPDDEAGESVALFVTQRPGGGLTEDDVLSFCRARLAKYMVPRSVAIVESLPLNANGKVVKQQLRAMATTAR